MLSPFCYKIIKNIKKDCVMRRLVAYIKIFLFVMWMLVNMPILIFVNITKVFMPIYAKLYFKAVCFIIGIKAKIKSGSMAKKKNLLLVCNHNSYLDIFALGSKLKINFVSKNDVKNWPMFGWIAKLGNTVFISRSRTKSVGEVSLMEKELRKRNVPLLVFPEGTSTDGNIVLPFKSSLFAMFEDYLEKGKKAQDEKEKLWIQPVSIAYTKRKNHILSDEERHNYAWYIKEQGLLEHLVNAILNMPVTLEINFGEPIDISNGFNDRKELASYCQKEVEKNFKNLVGKE